MLCLPLRLEGNIKKSKGGFSHFSGHRNSGKPLTFFSFHLLPLSGLDADTKDPKAVQSSIERLSSA